MIARKGAKSEALLSFKVSFKEFERKRVIARKGAKSEALLSFKVSFKEFERGNE